MVGLLLFWMKKKKKINVRKMIWQEATSHMNLGAMLHVNGKLTEAEQSYLEALRLKPDDHITRMNLQKLRHLLMKKGIVSSSSHSSPSQWMVCFDEDDDTSTRVMVNLASRVVSIPPRGAGILDYHFPWPMARWSGSSHGKRHEESRTNRTCDRILYGA